jgi:hypothetical protein
VREPEARRGDPTRLSAADGQLIGMTPAGLYEEV